MIYTDKENIYKLRGILDDWQQNIGNINEVDRTPYGDNPEGYNWIVRNFVERHGIIENALDKIRDDNLYSAIDCDFIHNSYAEFFNFQEEITTWLDGLDLKDYKETTAITGGEDEWSLNVISDLENHLKNNFIFALLDWIKEETIKVKQKILQKIFDNEVDNIKVKK